MLAHDVFDLRQPPSDKRRAALQKRLKRLKSKHMRDSVDRAHQAFTTLTGGAQTRPLRLRNGFAYRASPPGSRVFSDRSVPPRDARPPATQLMTPRGATMRFLLTVIAAQQAWHPRPGSKATNNVAIRPTGDSGWADLISSTATDADGAIYRVTLDARVRQVHSALGALERANLVELSGGGQRRSFDEFRLLDERAGMDRPGGDLIPYRVPSRQEPSFELPAAFISHDWVHVLEDSEIALLLMVACGLGNMETPPQVAISSQTRLLNYGISRDSYSVAHSMLSAFELLDVIEVGRRDDGRVLDFGSEDGKAYVHRLSLIPDGFENGGLETVIQAIESYLKIV